jgi:transposase
MITVFQFAEGLSDRAAADAVRSRIDWKYALGLELTDPGFDASVLVEFRMRLNASDQARLLFETLPERLREAKLVKAKGRQRTDSTRVLASVHGYNRLECVWEAMRWAPGSLAQVVPQWIGEQAPVAWYERYEHRFEEIIGRVHGAHLLELRENNRRRQVRTCGVRLRRYLSKSPLAGSYG